MHVKTAFVVLAALASASAIGCGSSKSSNDDVTGSARASLHRAKSCGDLLSDLKADATYKLNKAINLQIAGVQACVKKYGDDKCAYYGGYVGLGGSFGARGGAEDAQATGAATPAADPNSSGGGSKSSSATTYSQTNTQVKGVDEADIVKNDGKNLYVLHGRAFKVINAWPADTLKEMASIDVEGQPSEMFVADGKVVVYSQVNGAKVFQAAGVKPKTQYSDYGYGYAYANGGGAARAPTTDPGPGLPTDPSTGTPTQPEVYVPLTKVTVMQLNGTTPTVTREVYFEGNYLDSRRVGPHVRTVFQGYQYGPALKTSIYELYPQTTPGANPVKEGDTTGSGGTTTTTPSTDPYPKNGTQMIAALEQLRGVNLAAINATQLSDWLPYTFVKNGNAVSAQTVACEDFYVPTVGSTESGMTEVASLDLSDPASTPKETAILGRAETVYGNADTLYLAAQAWVEPPFMWNDQYAGGPVAVGGGTAASPPPDTTETAPAPAPAPAPKPGGLPSMKAGNLKPMTESAQVSADSSIVTWSQSNTHIHKFEFKTDAKFPNYVASGTVTGAVKDQFSMDDKDGYLRVATTENRQYVTVDGQYVQPDFNTTENAGKPIVRPNQVNHLFVLGQNGPWLDQAGDAGEIAPNETLQSVRFVDGRGYVVTFRRVDPLFVYDLQNPKAPTLLAALTIPGFSEYMHPLDQNHLLTIGRNATATGQTQGLELKVFDVTNGANPIVQHKFTYSSAEYGNSEAEYDHKAFTYFDDKQLLAFPYYSYGSSTMRSSLEIFKVDLATGFNKLGSIDHTPLLDKNPQGYCGGYFAPSVRRGVFLENVVYSVSYGGIVAKDANNLLGAGNQVALPSPETNDGYGPVCAADSGGKGL